MPTLPNQLCPDDLADLVSAAAYAILSDDDFALMIAQEFAESLDDAATELAGCASWRIVVVADKNEQLEVA